jgi:hypothetical protein
MENNFNEEEWEEIIPESDIWRPDVGDVFIGVYLKVTPNAGNWNKNKYTFKTPEGEKHIYGTLDLDNKMALARIGEMIRIELKAKIRQPAPKKDFLNFKVWHKALNKQTPSAANTAEGAASKPEEGVSKPPAAASKPAEKPKPAAKERDKAVAGVKEDDPEARETIGLIRKELNNNASDKMVFDYAIKIKNDWGLSENDLQRIKTQLF